MSKAGTWGFASPESARFAPKVGGAPWFTEILVLIALAFGYLFTIAVPLFGVHLQISLLKHFPFVLLVPALCLQLAASKVHLGANAQEGLASAAWPLALFAVYVTAGSALARWQFAVDETFLGLGLYMFLVPLLASCIRGGREVPWARASAFLAIAFALIALTGALARFSAKETLHEIEYVIVSSFVLWFYLARSRILKLVALLLMLGAVLFNQKLTGYIIAVLALMYICTKAGWRMTSPRWRGAFTIAAVVLSLLFVAALTFGYFEFRQYLPSGNDSVRLKQYEQAWLQFLKSPLWGNGFTDGSGEEFREHTRLLNIPTHSDLLDMLKHGGVLALGLFLFGYLKLIVLFTQVLARVKEQRMLAAYFTWIRFFMVTAMVTFAINPILLKGPYALVLWANVGIALGMALHLKRAAQAEVDRAEIHPAAPGPAPLRPGRAAVVHARARRA